MIVCRKCKVALSDENWNPGQKRRNNKLCKHCVSAYAKAKAYKHSPESRRAWRKANPIHYALSRIKKRAKDKGIPFNITKEDIIIPEYCPILGLRLEYSELRASDNSASLDRIEPAKGYVKGNVVVISYRANRIKNDATVEELEAIANWLRNNENNFVCVGNSKLSKTTSEPNSD